MSNHIITDRVCPQCGHTRIHLISLWLKALGDAPKRHGHTYQCGANSTLPSILRGGCGYSSQDVEKFKTYKPATQEVKDGKPRV